MVIDTEAVVGQVVSSAHREAIEITTINSFVIVERRPFRSVQSTNHVVRFKFKLFR